MKKLLFFLTSVAMFGQLSAQNPYKELGIKDKGIGYLTLSKGKYDEFHGYNDYEKVGSAIIDMRTNKIVRFVNRDSVIDEAMYEMDMTTRFMTADPLAEKYYQMSPYGYCSNNPINRIDPDGLTDFTLNQGTGAVTQVGDANKDPDRILKTDKNGNVKTKGTFLVRKSEQGKPKVEIGGIEQGILKNGMNLKSKDNIIAVGGDGQPTVKGVETFALNLSGYLGKEIAGGYFSGNNDCSTSSMTLGAYKNNELKKSSSTGIYLGFRQGLTLTGFFHTHPNLAGDSFNDRSTASQDDKESRDRALATNPTLKFNIITDPANSNGDYPAEIDYKNQ